MNSSHPGPAVLHAGLNETTASGIASLFAVYVCWGLFPLYWKNFAAVPPLEVVCHRSIWGLALLAPALCLTRLGREFLAACRDRRNLLFIGLCSMAHMANWCLHIWGSGRGRVLEISLGSYILPLLSVLAGACIFRERPRPLQWTALGLAACGVVIMTVHHRAFPWLALAIALTSATFAVSRKHAPVGAAAGLVMELAFTLPVLAGYMAWLIVHGQASMGRGDTHMDLLLVGAGVITALTQILYNYGLHRARMTTLGILQYVMPSVSFLLGVYAFNETVTPARVSGFGCIWAGLALYTLDGHRAVKS
ncbi:EamA family transporter RarD [Desulfovibrio aminophilus]|uniref:EamA family transporter RarD n=1 Tax=Desulfovibrio aminophilus TaxID=81425 RepID=UPI00339A2746